jgi:hypothetical protein
MKPPKAGTKAVGSKLTILVQKVTATDNGIDPVGFVVEGTDGKWLWKAERVSEDDESTF